MYRFLSIRLSIEIYAIRRAGSTVQQQVVSRELSTLRMAGLFIIFRGLRKRF